MAPRRIAVLSLALSAVFLLLCSFAAPAFAGQELQLNDPSPYWQVRPSAAVAADGGFLSLWEDMRRGVVARFLSPGGEPVGAEIVLATNTPFPEHSGHYDYTAHRQPVAVGLADGGFVAVWMQEDALLRYSYFWSDTDVRGRQILAQRFTSAGAPASVPWRVDAPGLGMPEHPAAAMLADGRVAIAWQRQGADVADSSVAARILDPADGSTSAEARISGRPAAASARPALAAAPGGGFVVVWTGRDADGTGVLVRSVDAAGRVAGPPARVNDGQQADQGSAAVAAAADGGFLVAWQHADSRHGVYRIVGRFLDAAARPVGGERVLTLPVSSRESSASLAPRPGGGFQLAWMGWAGNSPVNVAILELDAAGLPAGEPRVISSGRPQAQWRLGVAVGSAGALVSWEGLDGRSHAIRGRVLEAAPAVLEESLLVIDPGAP